MPWAYVGHQVIVFTADHPPGDYAYPEEITVCRLPVLFRFGNAPVLPGLLGLNGFDIVHLRYPLFFGSDMIFLFLTPFEYLLTDEGKRRAAGQRARDRVLREHIHRQRARELVRIV